MNLMSLKVCERLCKAVEKSKAKYADELLSKKVPVSARIAKEIGLTLDPKTTKALTELDAKPLKKGESSDVAQLFKLADYAQALDNYRKKLVEAAKKEAAAS